MKGRKKRPAALMRLENTRDRRKPAEFQPDAELGAPPAAFDEELSEEWYRIAAAAPRGVLTELDRGLVESYCGLRVAYRRALQEFLANPDIVQAGSQGQEVMSPRLKALESLSGAVRSAAYSLGFTPTTRRMIQLAEAEADPSDLATLIGAK